MKIWDGSCDEAPLSGRTERMLIAARNHAEDGGVAIVVGADKKQVDELRRRMRNISGGALQLQAGGGMHFLFIGERGRFDVHRKDVTFFVDSHAQTRAVELVLSNALRR